MLASLLLSALAAAAPDTAPGLALVRVLATAEGGLTDGRFVDAAAGADGAVFALMGDGTIRRHRGAATLPSWGEEGHFVRPEALAPAPGGGVYVRESGALTVLDAAARRGRGACCRGRWARRPRPLHRPPRRPAAGAPQRRVPGGDRLPLPGPLRAHLAGGPSCHACTGEWGAAPEPTTT